MAARGAASSRQFGRSSIAAASMACMEAHGSKWINE